jgi:hypothetical protein
VWDGKWNQGANSGRFANPFNGPYKARLIMTTSTGVTITNDTVAGGPVQVSLVAKAVLDNEFFHYCLVKNPGKQG